jgi:uncharacterized protein with PIN domain
MPNPQLGRNQRDLPLDEAMGFASHVAIRCSPPVPPRCDHSVIWPTRELYEKLPRCRTYRDFAEHLRCSKCGRRGWLEISPAGR